MLSGKDNGQRREEGHVARRGYFQKLIYFREEAIDEYIVNSQTEELFLDFKRADSSGKTERRFIKTIAATWPKAISGFGNSEGGVLIWGWNAPVISRSETLRAPK